MTAIDLVLRHTIKLTTSFAGYRRLRASDNGESDSKQSSRVDDNLSIDC